MFEAHQVSAEGVGDGGTRLLTDQHAGQVVPRAVGIAAEVDVGVEASGRDSAQVEGGGAQRPHLLPPAVPGRPSRQPDHRSAECLDAAGGEDDVTVGPSATASHRFKGLSGGLVDDEGGTRPIGVDGAETRRVPRQPARGVGGSVDGIEGDDDVAFGVVGAGLLAENAQPGPVENGDGGLVGGQVTAVLTRSRARQAPVVEHVERSAHGRRRLPQHVEEVAVGHPGDRSRGFAENGRLSPTLQSVAAIDVAGYVAELKDHAVDHGFHVHDERHFVETYSLRQVWEVDLHPEEGCGGPLDLHLALEVEPRVLLAFEDVVVELGEEDDPPDEFHLPLVFTWALPPLTNTPNLLQLAIDLPAIGGPDLPLEVSAIDSLASVTDAKETSLTIVARQQVSLARVFSGEQLLCEVLDRCLAVSRFLLDQAPAWL